MVCTLHEGDDFGKLALVTDSPRAASIVLREDNCHFLRVDKEDFNRILRVGGCIHSFIVVDQTHPLHQPSEATQRCGLILLWFNVCLPPVVKELHYTTYQPHFSLFSKDVEANTVRLKEHEQVVLVLEKSPRPSALGSIK